MRKALAIPALLLALCLTLLLAGCDSLSGEEDGPEAEEMTQERAQEMIRDGAFLLDVRTQEEYDAGHIPGAVLLPDYDLELEAEEVLTDKDETILVYCRTGVRSARSVNILKELGYTDVYDLPGGILEWTGTLVKG